MLRKKFSKIVVFLLFFSFPLFSETPEGALKRLKEGNQRFIDGYATSPRRSSDVRKNLIQSQTPFCSILACADSRVAPEIIFDSGLGDLFVVRLAGNVASSTAIESLDFSNEVLGVPLIIVMGHQNCGAVNAILNQKGENELGSIAALISPSTHGAKSLDEAILANIHYQVQRLKQSASLQPQLKKGQLAILGALYDFQTGKVNFLQDEQ